MSANKINVSAARSTRLSVEKVDRIAAACGVRVLLVDTRMLPGRNWMNDFEIEGEPGKVEAFLRKIKDVEL